MAEQPEPEQGAFAELAAITDPAHPWFAAIQAGREFADEVLAELPQPTPGLAKHIHIDRDQNGAPRITIDGIVIGWFTAKGGIHVPAPSLDECPTVTVTFLAEKVTMDNDISARAASD